MKLLYLFDDNVKPLTMTDKGYCKPAETGMLYDGIRSGIRLEGGVTNVVFGRNKII